MPIFIYAYGMISPSTPMQLRSINIWTKVMISPYLPSKSKMFP